MPGTRTKEYIVDLLIWGGILLVMSAVVVIAYHH